MKKLLLTGLLLGVAGAQAEDANFEIWNKTESPLYFQLQQTPAPSDTPFTTRQLRITKPLGTALMKLEASSPEGKTIKGRLTSAAKFFGKKATGVITAEGSDFYRNKINTNEKSVILLSNKATLKAGDKAVLITINRQNKDIFIRIKPDSSGQTMFAGDDQKYLVGPQTGLLGGITGKSERGDDLKNNVSQSDISINTDYQVQ